ncbi:MAG: VanW family protein [Christensenellales bacterium]|jgi:vancomycin resistance protein YoaR
MFYVGDEKISNRKLSNMMFLLAGALLALALIFSIMHFATIGPQGQGPAVPSSGQPSGGDDLPGVAADPSPTPQGHDTQPLAAPNKFFSGISIGGVVVEGQTKEQARAFLEESLRDKAGSLTLRYNDYSYTLGDDGLIGFSWNLDEVIEDAYALGRTGNDEEDRAVIERLKTQPLDFEITQSVEFLNIEMIAQAINSQAGTAPVEPSVSGFSPEEGFVFAEGTPGLQVDEVALENDIKQAVAAGNTHVPINIKMKEVMPETSADEVAGKYTLMAEFSTIAKKDTARNNNIDLALQQFNGLSIAPGQKVSFNETTGERTAAKGYQSAGVILNGVSAEDIGGGICQVSSTVFNAIIRAGLQIDVRNPHSWPSDYIAAGMDAMVDWPSSDLVFTNNSGSTVYMTASFDWSNRKLTVQVYGVPIYDPSLRVDLRAEKYEDIAQPDDRYTFDDSMYTDDIIVERNGRAGSRWHTYLQFFDEEGKLVEEKLAYNSTYRAIASKITVGSMSRDEMLYDIIDGKVVFRDPSRIQN